MVLINIKNPLLTNNGQLVDIFNFNPKKLSIEKVTDAINHDPEYIHYVKYDDLKGYFKYYKEKDTAELSSLERRKELDFIIKHQKQAKTHNQIWDKIKELINNIDGVNFEFSDYFRDHDIIRFDTDDTLPLYTMVNVYSMTIFIKSIYRTYYNRFYPQIYLTNCIYYKEC